MPEVVLGKTARQRILERYEAGSIDHEFRTTPISSSAQFKGDVVNVANGVGYLVIRPQKLKFFRKGEGDQIEFGSAYSDATDAETNLQKSGSTDGARDMAIEGLTYQACGTIVKYYETDEQITGFGTAPTNEQVLAALRGQAVICDPFGLVTPPQLQSPYLLEDAVFQQLLKLSTIELQLDTSRPYKLGGADLCPASAGTSYLHGSNGHSATYSFPEGILWQRDGQADSDLKVQVELHRDVVVPLSLPTFPGGANPQTLRSVYIQTRLRLHGVSVSELGIN